MTLPDWITRDAQIVAPRRRDDVDASEMEGELLLTDPVDDSTYHLNPTALAVWQGCDGRGTIRDIASSLTDAYEVDLDVALNDVEELIVWMTDIGLLQPHRC